MGGRGSSATLSIGLSLPSFIIDQSEGNKGESKKLKGREAVKPGKIQESNI